MFIIIIMIIIMMRNRLSPARRIPASAVFIGAELTEGRERERFV